MITLTGQVIFVKNTQMTIPRYLISFDSSKLPTIYTDILVVGNGIAGLRAAIEASKYGRVMVLAKDTLLECNTSYAQGGIASHLDDYNLVKTHIKDTLESGQGLNDPQIVQFIIKRGIENIRELIKWGVQFDKHGNKFDLAREGGHQLPRILHAGGDKTGKELLRVLLDKARQQTNIEIRDKVFVVDLLTTQSNSCDGVLAYQSTDKNPIVIQARKIILATGGIGQIYRETTNPVVATGDGIAMAYRAGAVLQDMEFVQFHPTSLYVAGAVRALISEAVRGAGGILVDKNGKRFMVDYHPMAELAPRDVVSRSIINQMRLTNDTSVYLDITHLPVRTVHPGGGGQKVKERFPGIYQLCQNFGINIAHDLIPVRPSAHYMIGGIRIRPDGATYLNNLFAAGECASSNFHGANRLGSNSLLESLVMGAICGLTAGRQLTTKSLKRLNIKNERTSDSFLGIDVEDARNSLKSLMWRFVGIERSEMSLKEALKKIEFWNSYILTKEFTNSAGWELQNMLTLAVLISRAALKRTESRGAHYRLDFPQTDDKHWKKHIQLKI